MGKQQSIWVCQTHPELDNHHFEECSEDGFCTECPKLEEIGILIRQVTKENNSVSVAQTDELVVSIDSPSDNATIDLGATVTIKASVKSGNRNDVKKVVCFVDGKNISELTHAPYTFTYARGLEGDHEIYVKAYANKGSAYESDHINISIKSDVPEIGLSVILMDASASMTEAAFKESPLTRLRLIATSAASGIFDLDRMQNNPNAYVAGFKFDDRIELMFLDTVANLIKKFDNDFKKFANYIHDELYQMQQGTDLNKALIHAHGFIDKFLKQDLPEFPRKKYKVMMQRILKHDSTSVSVPNIRVLVYTDGQQYGSNGEKTLMPNPFVSRPIAGLNHDIVIGAFFGQESDEGCGELKGLLSRCPIHDVRQFFLFDNPSKIGSLKFLFRMASGASGFCPKCLEKQLNK